MILSYLIGIILPVHVFHNMKAIQLEHSNDMFVSGSTNINRGISWPLRVSQLPIASPFGSCVELTVSVICKLFIPSAETKLQHSKYSFSLPTETDYTANNISPINDV